MTRLSPEAAKAMLSEHEDAVLVDVREPYEVAVGRIPGARNVPLRALANATREYLPVGVPVLFVCGHGLRSLTACAIAERAGFADVYSVDGGTARWAAEGFAYEGTPVP